MLKWLKRACKVRVLADTAFGSVDFLEGIRQLKLHAITGVRYDRKLSDGRQLFQLHKPGQRVHLQGLSSPVTIAWFYLKRDGHKKRSKRYILSPNRSKPAQLCGGDGIGGKLKSFSKPPSTVLDCIASLSKLCWGCTVGSFYPSSPLSCLTGVTSRWTPRHCRIGQKLLLL